MLWITRTLVHQIKCGVHGVNVPLRLCLSLLCLVM